MIIKKYFEIYLKSWYLPIVSAIGLLVIGYLTLSLFTKTTFDIAVCLFYLSFFLFFTSIILGVIKIFKKQYIKGILQIFISITTSFVSLGYINFFLMFYPNDYFADDLEIPKNIKLNIPIDEKKIIYNSIQFDLINSFQPGIYKYNFTTKKIDSGYVYIRAYEITKNIRLSEDELNKKSKVFVYNNSDSLKTFSTKEEFTIYEGDWDKPYASRFELWYISKKTGKERKLFEKKYKILGWQR